MNREEMNWLLQTIQDAKNEERFVLAQYDLGRISLEVMADAARKRGWSSRTANQFLSAATHHPAEYATTE
jgi:hypothetical protein